VDPDAFCHPAWRTWLRKRIGVGDDQPILLFLGRIHPKKGVDLLVRAFAGVLNLHPRAILVVAGSDAGSGYLDVIRRLAETSIPGVDVPTEGDPCGSSVCFLGEVAGELKAKVLAGADVFVLSSHSEGLPVAVLEAMASGLPVVITPGCHLPEVPAAGAGLLVEPSLDDMVRGLDRLLTDPRARGRMGEQGQRLVKEKFSWTGIAKQTVEAYQGQG
jgi:glycosyltransferase involved in cell wall biosynthesis